MKRRSVAKGVRTEDTKPKGKSRYAKKLKRGDQMYGPGCCAHSLTQEQMVAIRRENGTLRPERREAA